MHDDIELICLVEAPIPDHLPTLARGRHQPGEGRACAMEAASWLAGEPWSDHPRSVHPIIAGIARAANDSVGEDMRQQLWPLILASIGTGAPHRPLLRWRLQRAARRLVRSERGGVPAVWDALLVEHARLTGHQLVPVQSARLATLEEHLRP